MEIQEHTYSEWTNDESQGKHYKKCTVCDNKIYEEHIESVWIIDTEADVGIEGKQHTQCSQCNKIMQTETIPAIVNYIPLTVIGGKAMDSDGNPLTQVAEGEKVVVIADTAPDGQRFSGWTADGIELQDASLASVTFTMPGNEVRLEAHFIDADKSHTHQADTTKWIFDEEEHWHACRDNTCSERIDKAVHNFAWKADILATDSAEGTKHEECTVCGKKRNENTVIPKGGPNPEWTDDQKGSDGDGKKNAWILPVIIAGASILIGAGVTTAIVMLMKKKKKAV